MPPTTRLLLSAFLALGLTCASSRADDPAPVTIDRTVSGSDGAPGDAGINGAAGGYGSDGHNGGFNQDGGDGGFGTDGTNGERGGNGGTGSAGYTVNGDTVNFLPGAQIFGGAGGAGGVGGLGGDGGYGGNGGNGGDGSPFGGNGGIGGDGGYGGNGGDGGDGGAGGVGLRVIAGDVHIFGGSFSPGLGGSRGLAGWGGSGGFGGAAGSGGAGEEMNGDDGWSGTDGSFGGDGAEGSDGENVSFGISIEGGHVTFHSDLYDLNDLGGGAYALSITYADASTSAFNFYSANSGLFSFESVTPVPEPSTYAALLGAAALGTVIWQRRRARVVSAQQ